MTRLPGLSLVVAGLLSGGCGAPQPSAPRVDAPLTAAAWRAAPGPDLPTPVANNAVAAAVVGGRSWIFSFLGIGPGRDHRAITLQAFALDVEAGRWERLPDVPGSVGRLAATAQAIGEDVYLCGGYEVAADGTETTSPTTLLYRHADRHFVRRADAPVAVDDAVSGVWRDRLIFLVSGWSADRTVTTVQAYDPAADRWRMATPIPGTPVFGHAGGIVNDTIVYCGGALMRPGETPKYAANAECYRGDLDPANPTTIEWRQIAPHPGAPRYRAAAGPVRTASATGILFVGGTANPYNYNGVGYDVRPAEPESAAWLYDVNADRWVAGPRLDRPTMDHRGLVEARGGWWTIGGFAAGQAVTAGVTALTVDGKEQDR
ncbi:MAG: kelch repeat-containing protein [Vicinamibacterales bacterium]